MSSRSRYVPRSMMVASVSPHRSMNSERAAAASSWQAKRFGTAATADGSPVSREPRTSASAPAGAVDSTSVTTPSRALFMPSAAAQVVLPTPPLPPTRVHEGSDARRASMPVSPRSFGVVGLPRDAHGTAGGGHPEPLAPGTHVTEALHHIGLPSQVFGIIDVAELQEHLQFHELLLDGRVVNELLLDDALHLA